jgi:ABC-type lipoprotein export system ATPase subunit
MAALDRVDLTDRADFLPTRLSGGQQQRAAIARALMGEPSLLLCDEPTGNLDSANAESVLDLFEQLSAQDTLTLAVITHDEHVASRAHRRVRIIDGVLREVETALAPDHSAPRPP